MRRVVCIFATFDVNAIVQSDVVSLALDTHVLAEMSVRVKAFESKSANCLFITNPLMDESEVARFVLTLR